MYQQDGNKNIKNMYAKIINSKHIEVAPRNYMQYSNFDKDTTLLSEYGYKEVIEMPQLDHREGYYISPTYSELDGDIIKNWEYIESPIDNENDYIGALTILGINL